MSEHQFRKGDLVRFRYGVLSVEGRIKEDRGPIGRLGRRLYLIEFPLEDETAQIELAAADLEPLGPAVSRT